jgi:glycyl-tRNA synthetase beta chain
VESPLPLLLEIGVEELPSSYVDAALDALPKLIEAKLAEVRLAHGAIHAHGTPRRLAVIVDGVAAVQSDLDEEVVGPPEAAAFKDGKPTRAAEAFATKLGIAVGDLAVAEQPAVGNKKAGRYLVGRRKETGRKARELLAPALTAVAGAIPFRKSMRWGAGDATFGRPVQWLVALLGEEVIPMTFAGKNSGRETRGHRFLAPATFTVKSADSYVESLRKAHVLVDRNERAKTMMALVEKAAREAGGVHDPAPYLVDENASLVEEPHVVRGSFEPQYLELPAAVIRAVARGHQKYFCVQKSEDELLPVYLTVANTANDPGKVAKGNDRVMRARLADARFFFDEDKKAALDARVEKLAGIVFHARLGTVREKVARLEVLTMHLAEKLGLPEETQRHARRAARLCKSDLVSLMVGEFPELQGHMGRAYAQHAKEADAVADAIRDHYRPVGAQDAVAGDDVSAVVALADRIDTLVGCFAIGLSPTGAADPYALRRACIAALRTLVEAPASNAAAYARLDFGELIGAAYDLYVGKKLELTREATVAKVSEFARERLRGLLAVASGAAVADAVLGGRATTTGGANASIESHPTYAFAKAKALAAVVEAKEPWLEQARTVAKRLNGISKAQKPVLHTKEDFAGSSKDEAIVAVVDAINVVTGSLSDEGAVSSALHYAEQLAKRVDEIFVTTLVNDPQDPLTPKRLELLSFGAECMLRICDFSRLG